MTEFEARQILADEMESKAPKVFGTMVHHLRQPNYKMNPNTAWPAVIAAMLRANTQPQT